MNIKNFRCYSKMLNAITVLQLFLSFLHFIPPYFPFFLSCLHFPLSPPFFLFIHSVSSTFLLCYHSVLSPYYIFFTFSYLPLSFPLFTSPFLPHFITVLTPSSILLFFPVYIQQLLPVLSSCPRIHLSINPSFYSFHPTSLPSLPSFPFSSPPFPSLPPLF